jgi:phosphoglucomutase
VKLRGLETRLSLCGIESISEAEAMGGTRGPWAILQWVWFVCVLKALRCVGEDSKREMQGMTGNRSKSPGKYQSCILLIIY